MGDEQGCDYRKVCWAYQRPDLYRNSPFIMNVPEKCDNSPRDKFVDGYCPVRDLLVFIEIYDGVIDLREGVRELNESGARIVRGLEQAGLRVDRLRNRVETTLTAAGQASENLG